MRAIRRLLYCLLMTWLPQTLWASEPLRIAVAANFNSMAAKVGFGFPWGLLSAFILFFGNTLNIVWAQCR